MSTQQNKKFDECFSKMNNGLETIFWSSKEFLIERMYEYCVLLSLKLMRS